MLNIDEQQLNYPICKNIDKKGNYIRDNFTYEKIELNRLEETRQIKEKKNSTQ